MIAPLLAGASIGLAAGEPMPVDLLALARRPAAYAGKTVRTCGWASNAAQDRNIGDDPETPAHLMDVAWLPETPVMRRAVRRCVTGVVEPVCAVRPAASKSGDEVICIGSDWQLRQTTASEN